VHAVAIDECTTAMVDAVARSLPSLVANVRAVATAEEPTIVAEAAVTSACDLAEDMLAAVDEVRMHTARQQEWAAVTRTMVGPSKKEPATDPAQEDIDLARARLEAEVISRVRGAIRSTLASKLPFLKPPDTPGGLTPGGMAGWIAMITAAATTLGVGAKKVNGLRKDRNQARAAANDYHDAMGSVVDAAKSGKADVKAIDKIMTEHRAAKALHAQRKAEEVAAGTGLG